MESSMYPRRPARARHLGTIDTRPIVFERRALCTPGVALSIIGLPVRGEHTAHVAVQIERDGVRLNTIRLGLAAILAVREAIARARDGRTGVAVAPGLTRDVHARACHDCAVTLALHDHEGVRCGRAIPVRPVMHAALERALEWLAGAQ